MQQVQIEQTWLQRQEEAERAIRALEQQKNTFQDPKVIVNPYQIAPLTALILFQTEQETTVQVTVAGIDGAADFTYSCGAARKHRVPVYGLYTGCSNRVQLQLSDGQCCTIQIQTEPAPANLAACKATGDLPMGEWMFTVPVSGSSLPAAYDGSGACRWYLSEELAFQISRAKNGRLLSCGPALLSPPYSAAAIWEFDLLGKLYREYRIPGGVCNGFFEMADGDFLALHQHFLRGTAADLCVQIDRGTGEIVKTWDLRTLLPMMKGGSPSQTGSDWFHASSIWYDQAGDGILIAGSHQDVVVQIGYTSGQLNWILGDPTGWPAELVQQYFLRASQDTMDWCYEPGWVQMLPDHQLLCFDNGHLRTKKGGTPLPAEDRYSRVVCYQIHPDDRTVEEVWSLGKEAGNAWYSPYLSSCHVDDAGRCLINFGGIGVLQDTVAEPPAFFLQKDFPEVQMQTVILLQQEHQTRCSMELPINCYDAACIAVSSCALPDLETAGAVLGRWHGNDVYALELDWEDGGMLADTYQLQVRRTKEQLLVSGVFQQGEMVLLLLEGDTLQQFYMQTTRAPYLTAGKQTFAKGSDRPIQYVVSLEELSGTYEINIGIDDKKYHTGLWITV